MFVGAPETIRIQALAYEGAGVGRLEDGRAVFVPDALPDELVQVAVERSHERYAAARLVAVLEPAPQRCAPPCEYHGLCGSCPWQILDYSTQLYWKRRFVVDALERIGGVAGAEGLVAPCRASKRQWGYRNKVEFSLTSLDKRIQLGMHGRDQREVVPVSSCLMLPPGLKKAPGMLSGALSYALKDPVVSLERVGIRTSQRTGDCEIALWGKPGAFPRAMAKQVLSSALPASSLMRVLLDSSPKERKVKGVEVLGGKGYWSEALDGRTMKLSAPSFFQVNTAGAQILISLVVDALEQLDVGEHSPVADLYCGAGTLTLPLCERFSEVYAIESEKSSLRDLRRNLADNGLDADVIGGDVARELAQRDRLAAAVVDPPRSGLAKEALRALVEARPAALVYVSCNPATLARDIAGLVAQGYQLKGVTPVDLFPQSYHVECVALLSLPHPRPDTVAVAH
ncbi:MAG: 23S rRNA (uracil(1939)-C(5))-methyltransferase RlmD [Coriobacteriales bacterium]|nr:23S rRNA (uracil(1939)-C(5))-methyltransferase RlmD [Coriobacteriales bacterium]